MTVKEAIQVILSDTANYGKSLNYAVNYAKAGLTMEGEELRVQCIYILCNLAYWRHSKAKEVRAVLKRASK